MDRYYQFIFLLYKMSVDIDHVLDGYEFFDNRFSDKKYDLYCELLKRTDWEYLIKYIVTYHKGVSDSLIKAAFNTKIEAFLIFYNYGLVKSYEQFDIINAITQDYTLNHPEIYQFLVQTGHKHKTFNFSIINFIFKAQTQDLNVDNICDIVAEMFIKTKMRIPDRQKYIRTFARLHLTRVLDFLRLKNYDIHTYVQNVTYPEIESNKDYRVKLNKYIYKYQHLKSYRVELDYAIVNDPYFFELARYLLFKSAEIYKFTPSEIDSILLKMYKFGLQSNLAVAALLGEYGYVTNASLSEHLIQNPEFYENPSIYQKLLSFGEELGVVDLEVLIDAFGTRPITKPLKDFIYRILRKYKSYDDDMIEYIKYAAKNQSPLIKYMIITFDADLRDIIQKFIYKAEKKNKPIEYYLDILEFIDDYENNNLPVLYRYYDTATQDFIKSAFMSMYVQTKLPYELMMEIIIRAM